jgi:Gpi18-like mannosyltransferase
MKKIIILFLMWICLILLTNKLSARFIQDRTSYELPGGVETPFKFTITPFLNFDGRNYLDIARSGYFEKNGHNLKVFFPLYPFLIKYLWLNGLFNLAYVGIAISVISGLISIFIFNKMFGFRATVLLLAFPTSFFFAAYYTESIFLLFILAFFLFLEKKSYFTASLFAALASGTRIQGIILALILFYEIIKNKEVAKKYLWTVIIAPLGFAYYLFRYGPSIILGQGGWNRQVGLLGPVRALSDSLRHIIQGPLSSYDSIFVYPIIILEFLMFIFAIIIVFKMYKKIEMKYFIYSFASLLLILLGGSLASSPRYLLVIFPIFIYLAKVLKGSYYFYLGISISMLIFLTSLFLRGYWVA